MGVVGGGVRILGNTCALRYMRPFGHYMQHVLTTAEARVFCLEIFSKVQLGSV